MEQKKEQFNSRERLYASLLENFKRQTEILKQEIRISRLDLMDIIESVHAWHQENIQRENTYISNILKLEDRYMLLQNEIHSAREVRQCLHLKGSNCRKKLIEGAGLEIC